MSTPWWTLQMWMEGSVQICQSFIMILPYCCNMGWGSKENRLDWCHPASLRCHRGLTRLMWYHTARQRPRRRSSEESARDFTLRSKGKPERQEKRRSKSTAEHPRAAWDGDVNRDGWSSRKGWFLKQPKLKVATVSSIQWEIQCSSA